MFFPLNKPRCKTYFIYPKGFRQNEVLSKNNDFFLRENGNFIEGSTSKKKHVLIRRKKKDLEYEYPCRIISYSLTSQKLDYQRDLINDMLYKSTSDLPEISHYFFFRRRFALYLEERKLPLFCLTMNRNKVCCFWIRRKN